MGFIVEQTGIEEIDEFMRPYICSVGSYDLRRISPKYLSNPPQAQVHELEAVLPNAVPHDNDSLKKQTLRHTKNFLIRANIPSSMSLQSIHDEFAKKIGADVCIGLLNTDGNTNDIMAYIHKDHTKHLKSDAFCVGQIKPLAVYNIIGRGLCKVLCMFAKVVLQTYSSMELCPQKDCKGYGFEQIMHATKAMSQEQFITLKGNCLSVQPKKRTEFQHAFLRVVCALADMRREGLVLTVVLIFLG